MSAVYSRHPSGVWRWTCEECGATGIADTVAGVWAGACLHRETCRG